MFSKKLAAIGTTLSTALLPAAAFAQSSGGVDVSEGVTKIQAAGVAGAAIGLATLVMLIGIKVFKWVRAGM